MANHSRKKNLASAPQQYRLDCQHRHPRPGIRHREHRAKGDADEPTRPPPSAAPSPAEREQRADRGGSVIGVREAEGVANHLAGHVFQLKLPLSKVFRLVSAYPQQNMNNEQTATATHHSIHPDQFSALNLGINNHFELSSFGFFAPCFS